MARILVTGANGQLGQELWRLADRHPEHEFFFAGRQELDLSVPELIHMQLENIAVQFVVNCAAYTAVDKAETEWEEAVAINGAGPGYLADACRHWGAKLIHVSTDYVFNGQGEVPYTEEDAPDPVNRYGLSKLIGEREALRLHEDTLVLRTSWVYSPFGNNFVKTMLRLMRERDSINVVSDQWGSPTYAADLAEVIMEIIAHPKWAPGIYHYSNEGVITWHRFAEAIRDLKGFSCAVNAIPTEAYPTPAKRPRYSVLDKRKIVSAYGVELKEWSSRLQACLERMEGSGFS
ncbi:MAG TPA: dTDP-4-dehydrorhamnose reductase [Chitinophagaceae bacterium]|jgi:dTDP-4-dehydrorhamnose reductase|nr:dTDP-4-dehydrorhamnose reductase [Chitinophagaceae bacterium]